MLKITFTQPTFIFSGDMDFGCLFCFAKKVIFDNIHTPIFSNDSETLFIPNDFKIQSIEHVKPTEL